VRVFGVLAGLCATLALAACADNANHLTTHYVDRFATPKPTLAEFTVCHGFGCSERSNASLSLAEWHKVIAVFRPRPRNAAEERKRITHAVALIERTVGPRTGTAAHQWTHKNMLILPNLGDTTQLDCVDEAVNTWTYMSLMERGNLLRFHRVAPLSNAGSLTDPNMRNTAVLEEKNGGGFYAVDASLVDYGKPPLVMPLAVWMGSWPPKAVASEEPAKTHGHRPAKNHRKSAQSAKKGKPPARPASS
jgi:hypothetical protein